MDKSVFKLYFAVAVLSLVSSSEGGIFGHLTEADLDPKIVFKGFEGCPKAPEISPCTCENETKVFAGGVLQYILELSCTGPNMTQANIDQALKSMASTPLPPGRQNLILHYNLVITGTTLTQLDLNTLLQHRYNFSNLFLLNNPQMIRIIDRPSSNNFNSSLRTLTVQSCPLNNQGVEKLLGYFSTEDLLFLELKNTSVEGSTGKIITKIPDTKTPNSGCPTKPVDLIMGLSAFKSLKIIRLYNNKIRELRCGPFASFPNLDALHLSGIQLEKIGENGLLLYNPKGNDDPDESVEKKFANAMSSIWKSFTPKITVTISNTSLDQNGLVANSGLRNNTITTILELSGNKFSSLPDNIFEPFMAKNPDNVMVIKEKRLVCDDKLDWILGPLESKELSVKAPGLETFCRQNSSPTAEVT